ncbi:Hypothetical protein LUCI_1649 [Lucifera butyrica]|uniref:Uncharacterized protein n=1 Tax=Lucifera butyrica TaxID=1351585 RepID=A0A498RBB0_9FIRM|nr:hypothetical protein [Lucifera butyrica]VBB06418.1 Hypothetical protein LUCI_1649 [Lucifera butyrica]
MRYPMMIMPVANGILPRPNGGRITGMFIMEAGGKVLAATGRGRDILICPMVAATQDLYPVGIVTKILDIWPQTVKGEDGRELSVLMAALEGRSHARWHSLRKVGNAVLSPDIEYMNFKEMHKKYPAVSGAGWIPAGGYTEFCGPMDISVTLYGNDLETGKKVSLKAQLGGLVEQEQAHTIEHAMIRALRTYGLCTPRTLIDSIAQEATELKQSVENSIKYTMPELLGLTASGACGNPMTNLAQFYLAKEFVGNIQAGKALNESLTKARRTTMSRLTQDMDLTMQQGIRILQGLKRGMSHDDTPLKLTVYKKVIGRFPFEPWE